MSGVHTQLQKSIRSSHRTVPLHIGFSSEGHQEPKRLCVAQAKRDDVCRKKVFEERSSWKVFSQGSHHRRFIGGCLGWWGDINVRETHPSHCADLSLEEHPIMAQNKRLGIKVCTARSFEKETDKMERSNTKSLLHRVFEVLTGDRPIKAGLCSSQHLLHVWEALSSPPYCPK